MKKKALRPVSGGLIGSAAVRSFGDLGFDVIGVGNDMRRHFCGDNSVVRCMVDHLAIRHQNFREIEYDIRNGKTIHEELGAWPFQLCGSRGIRRGGSGHYQEGDLRMPRRELQRRSHPGLRMREVWPRVRLATVCRGKGFRS